MNNVNLKPVSLSHNTLLIVIFILLIACCNSGKQIAVTSRMEFIDVIAFWTKDDCFINDTCELMISITNNSEAFVQIEANYNISLRHARKNDEVFGDDHSLRHVSPKKESIILLPNKQTELIIEILTSSDFFESGTNNILVYLLFISDKRRYIAVSNEIEIYIADL